jgi:hypothetical protein
MKRYKQLDFDDYVKKLPSSVVFKHLVKNGGKERKILSSDLIENIRKKYVSKESLVSRFDALCPEAKMVCALAYVFGSGGLTVEEHGEYREELLISFLIYSAHDTDGREFYCGFRDIEELLRETLAIYLCNCLKVDKKKETAPFFGMRCLNDFIMILILARKGLLKKKKDTNLNLASIQELNIQLHRTSGPSFTNKDSQKTENGIQLLLSYGKEREYLTENSEAYVTTLDQVNSYLSQSHDDLYKDFVDYTIKYTGDWSIQTVNAIFETAGDYWLSAESLPSSCREKITAVLETLHYTGIIDARTGKKDTVWKRVSSPVDFNSSPRPRVVILADFTVILPQEVLPETLFNFSLLGSFTNFDRVYKGVIDRDTVNESLSSGITGDEIISHLVTWEAPDNIIETVREWIREYSRVGIIKNDVILAFDEKSSLQISSYEAMKDIIEPLTAHTVYKIKKGRENEVMDQLKTMGFDPRMPEVKSPQQESAKSLVLTDTVEEPEVSFNFKTTAKNGSRPVTSGKYSEELKELDISEMCHVIDYAILMGHGLKIEYEGNADLKEGTYTIAPQKFKNGVESYIDGKDVVSGKCNRYYIKEIKKIGVKSG